MNCLTCVKSVLNVKWQNLVDFIVSFSWIALVFSNLLLSIILITV